MHICAGLENDLKVSLHAILTKHFGKNYTSKAHVSIQAKMLKTPNEPLSNLTLGMIHTSILNIKVNRAHRDAIPEHVRTILVTELPKLMKVRNKLIHKGEITDLGRDMIKMWEDTHIITIKEYAESLVS